MNIDLRNCLLANFCKLIPVCLDGSNYVNWKFMLETMLRGCGLMKYIDGSFPCPSQYIITGENEITSEMSAEYISWKQNDYAVMTLLAATLSSDVLSFVVGSNNSKELWFLLKERYASTSWFNKQQLKTNFYKLIKGSDSVDKYLDRVKIALDQLANVGIHMSDEDIIDSVLLGLPSEFATMKTIIRVKPSPISIQELRSLLSNRPFNGSPPLQSQVYNPSYGDGYYFQQIGDFSRQQNSGLQQNNGCRSIGNLSYSGCKSQGQTQLVNFKKESTKPKGGVSQHNVGSYHKERNSNSGNGCYMHIPPIHVPLASNKEYESMQILKEKSVDSTLEDSSKTLGELVAETAEASSSSGMEYGECKERKLAKAQFHGVRDEKLQKEASGTEVVSHTVPSSSALIDQVQGGGFMQSSHRGSALLPQRLGMQNFYGIGISNGGQSCNGPQQMQENGGVFYQQKNRVKNMMNCRQHYQPTQLCPSVPLIPPG